MEFIIDLSKYVLGNLRTVDPPNSAIKALEEGYDTPSLIILAGLGNDVWEIEEYLRFTLEEMNIKLPSEKEAGLTLMKYYIHQIVKKEIDPVEGIERVIFELLRKTSLFDGKNKKYAYDYIGFENLYGLYYEFDDMMNPLVVVSDEYRKRRIIEIRQEIIQESADLLEGFEVIENKILNS